MPSLTRPALSRRRFLAAGSAAGLATLLGLPAHAIDFEPQLGRTGKDVMWLPTPDALITRLLTMAGASADDRLVDLGSGDGRFVIAAARDFGLQARGVEYDPKMVEYAVRKAAEEGLSERARFVQGDVFATDFSDASIVAIYLLPALNLRLRPTLLAMKPGTRIITHAFDMGQWQPDEHTTINGRTGYLWIVPANVGGTWQLTPAQGEPLTLQIEQRFQRLRGTVQQGELITSLRNPRLSGTHLTFSYTDAKGVQQMLDLTLDGEQLRGTRQGSQAVTAVRIGATPPLGGGGPASEEEMHAAVRVMGDY